MLIHTGAMWSELLTVSQVNKIKLVLFYLFKNLFIYLFNKLNLQTCLARQHASQDNSLRENCSRLKFKIRIFFFFLTINTAHPFHRVKCWR